MAGLLLAAAGLYIGMGMRYQEIFCPNTVTNGTDVSGLSIKEVKSIIDSKIKQYILTIETRNGSRCIPRPQPAMTGIGGSASGGPFIKRTVLMAV